MDETKKIQERIKIVNIDTEQQQHEQVIFICPGCNMNKNNADKKKCCDCAIFCRKSAKKLKLLIFSGPGLTLLLLSYLMVGAVTFNVLEGGRKFDFRNLNTSKNDYPNRDVKIKEAVERLWKITENLNVLYKDNWTKLAGEEINNLQEYFFDVFRTETENVIISECNTKNYHQNRKKNPPFWNLGECFLYSLSLLTTVGSGNILPKTILGRVISIFYISIGFFIMLVYLAVIGDYLANPFRRFYSFITHTSPKNTKPVLKCTIPNCNKATLVYKETISIPVWLAMLVLVMYITGGAFIFNFIEKWTLLDSWYFCFLSLVTIGFGSCTPGRMESISMIATSAYILIGMTLLSMCFNLIQTDMIMFFRNLYIWSEREDTFALPPTRIGS